MKSLDATFFSANRKQVMEKLNGGLLVVPAYTKMQTTNDESAEFKQEANFWYLTGIEYADWWLIIDAARGREWLVAPEVQEMRDLFDGSLSPERATEISGVRDIIKQRAGEEMLEQAARTRKLVYMVDNLKHHDFYDFTMNPSARDMREKLSRQFASVEDFRLEIARLRAIKQPREIEVMQAAINLTVDAFKHVYTARDSYKYEYEIEAEFTYRFRRAGAKHAYDPIVAHAGNAYTVHYMQNSDKIKRPSLLLMDIGARVGGYAADITRTYALGKQSQRTIAIFTALQQAQRDIIGILRPGLKVEDYQKQSDDIMKRALIDLKLIDSMTDEDGYRKYFPYAISHGLGIDVHDALGRPSELRPGMVLTVEPGIHIADQQLGMRIEDDILITETGHRNLSAKLSTDL